MDPYLRPILISTGLILIFNTVLILPIISSPIVTYFLGGFVAVMIFRSQFIEKDGDDIKVTREINMMDIAYLGLGTGLIAGCILALIFAFKIQDEEFKRQLIELINEATRMKSNPDMDPIDDLAPMFVTVVSVITIIFCGSLSYLGSLSSMPFINKAKK